MMLYRLILIVGLAYVAHGTERCLSALKCAKLYRRFNTHKDLHETPYALNKECTLQARFFACLRDLSPEYYRQGYDLPLPEEFEKTEDALIQLCAEGTDLRERYLVEAACINSQDAGYCTSKEYLGTDLEIEFSPSKRCVLAWKSRDCIATLLRDSCSEEAVYLYKQLAQAFEPEDDCTVPDDEDEDPFEYEYDYEDTTEATTWPLARSHVIPEGEISEAEPDEYQRSSYLRDLIEVATRKDCSEGNLSGVKCDPEYAEHETSVVPRPKFDARSVMSDVAEAAESSEIPQVPSEELDLIFSDEGMEFMERSGESESQPTTQLPFYPSRG